MKNTNSPSQLTLEQVNCFYRLWFGLLEYANERYKPVESMLGKDFHQGISSTDAAKIADHLWAHSNIFDGYLNTAKLDKREQQIVRAWKKYHLKNKFYLVKHLENGSVFLSREKDEKPYLVKGLVSTFAEIWPKQALPSLVETVLLPYEGAITTCGLYQMSRIIFGNNISREIRDASNQAELIYGLINSLPYMQNVSQESKDIGQIKFYLRSTRNLEEYGEDLEKLISKNPKKYLSVYYYQRGLLEAKKYKKEYRKLGIKKLHFALYGAISIAAHTDRQQVDGVVKKLVAPNELNRVVFDMT